MTNAHIKEGSDKTLSRNNIKYWKHLISEYELIKDKRHNHYNFVQEFYKSHNIKRQNFIKYYNRYKQSGLDTSLLPRKRGPRYKKRCTPGFIEQKVITLSYEGFNRYSIYSNLQESLKQFTPSPSTIYNICKRNGLNRLKPKMVKNKRKIIKKIQG